MNKTILMISTLVGLAAAGESAMAASPWPLSVVGTWNMSANQSKLVLTIKKQSGSTICKDIVGTLVDSVNGPANIVGFYCPFSGRLSFLRNAPTSSITYQVFTGNLSYPGGTTYMSGVFEQEGQPTPGEYDWWAMSQPPS